MYGWDDDDDDKSANDDKGYHAKNERLRKDAGIFDRKKREKAEESGMMH